MRGDLQEGRREGGEARRDEEIDQEGVAPLREGGDDEEGGEEEDEAPLAGEGEGDPRHGERGERRHARKEGRGASLGAVGEEVGRVEGRGAKGGYQLCQQRRALCEDKSRERGGGGVATRRLVIRVPCVPLFSSRVGMQPRAWRRGLGSRATDGCGRPCVCGRYGCGYAP